MDLVELLKRPEGKTLEFKRELSAPEGALKTIIAFANTAGGTLLVGVEDRSGAGAGDGAGGRVAHTPGLKRVRM
jgi:predicted HTH transcriptional regulator